MRYFVTGGTGFLGSRLVRLLVDKGHEVVAVVRSIERAAHLAELGVAVHEGDITDKASMRKPMEGVDGVFHLAAWYKIGARDSSMAHSINVDGTRNVLELMRELSIPKGVYTSTVAVYGNTEGKSVDETYRFNGAFTSVYEETKWRAHYEVAEPMVKDGLPLVMVHPGVVYGPGDTSAIGDMIRDYLKGKLPAVPRDVKYCWCYIDDVVESHWLAMEKGTPGASYNTTGPQHSLVEVFDLAEKLTGIKAPRIKLSGDVMQVLAGMVSIFEVFRTFPENMRPETLRNGAHVTYLAENTKAREELGATFRDLESGLRPTLAAAMQDLGMEVPFETKAS